MASEKVTVKAGANGPVVLPQKLDGLDRIGDASVEVESTRFIRGRINCGDLVVVEAAVPVIVVTARAPRAAALKVEE